MDVGKINDVKIEFPGPIHWAQHLAYRIHMVIICCWWLLRGIEAAAVMLTQAWTEITHSGRNAFITCLARRPTSWACALPGPVPVVVIDPLDFVLFTLFDGTLIE